MIKYIFPIIFSTAVFSQDEADEKEKFVLINLTDKEQNNKNEEIKKEEALKLLLNEKFPISAKSLKKFQDSALKERAILSSINTAENYISDVVLTSIEPGSKSIPITLSRGLPLSIVLKDTKGNPVNYYDIIDSADLFSACKPGTCSSNNNEESGQNNIRPNNVIVLRSKAVLGGGILPVYTSHSDIPLSFKINVIESPGSTYIDRLIVIVDVGNDETESKESNLKTLDSLTRALNGLSPVAEAKILYFNGPVKAWRHGNQMWIRTQHDMKIPSVTNSSSKLSLNGVNVYRTRFSSVISVIDNNNAIVRYQQELSHE